MLHTVRTWRDSSSSVTQLMAVSWPTHVLAAVRVMSAAISFHFIHSQQLFDFDDNINTVITMILITPEHDFTTCQVR